MKVAWLFPGQGSQAVGMGRDLFESSVAARAVFDAADATLGFPLSRLCFEGPLDELTRTENAQPAILTVSAALLAALGVLNVALLAACQEAQEPATPAHQGGVFPRPQFVAGHSLGEYSALIAAGVLSFPAALRLVRRRGELMAQADEGAMAAVLGMDNEALEQVVVAAAEGQELVIANYNAPGQLVISGVAAAVERATALARSLGAKRVLPLNVSAAFHSPLMARAASALAPAIEAVELMTAFVPVVANVQAMPLRQIGEIRQELLSQITAPVRWIETVRFMAAQGVDTFVEIGPGTVLTGLVRRIFPGATIINIQGAAQIAAIEAAL